MAKELDTTEKDQYMYVFYHLMKYTENLCTEGLSKFSSGTLDQVSKISILLSVHVTACEGLSYQQRYFGFLIPEAFLTLALDTIKQLNLDFKSTIALGYSVFCATDECMNLVYDIIFEEFDSNPTLSMSAFVTWKYLKETNTFDKLVRTMFHHHQSGRTHQFSKRSVAGTILYGPVTKDSTEIFMHLLDDNLLKYLCRGSQNDYNHLIRIISQSGKTEEFRNKIKEYDFPFIELLEGDIVKHTNHYEIIKMAMSIDITSLSLDGCISHILVICDNQMALRYYYEIDAVLCNEVIVRINKQILKIFELVEISGNNGIDSLVPLKSAMILLLFLPNFQAGTASIEINYEPLLDYLLNPEIDPKKICYDFRYISMAITTPFAKISNAILEKTFMLFDRYNAEHPTHLEQMISDIVSAPIRYDGQIERTKIIYTFFSAKGVDVGSAALRFISRISEISDLKQRKDMLSFALEHQIISKSAAEIIRKLIKSDEDKINRLF